MKDVLGPGIKDRVGAGREQDPRNQEALQEGEVQGTQTRKGRGARSGLRLSTQVPLETVIK